jgi:hypothetical protein
MGETLSSVWSQFDLLVIGTGGAGMAAALQGAEMGARVGIVEGDTLGGTCVNVGCIPSKNLIEAAARYHAARNGFPGITGCEPTVDWEAVIRQKDRSRGAESRVFGYPPGLLELPGQYPLELPDTLLVPLVERPLLDPLPPHQPRLRQHPHVLAQGGLTHAELAGQEQPADPVLGQVAVHMRREVGPGLLEPLQDLKPSLVGEGAEEVGRRHIAN